VPATDLPPFEMTTWGEGDLPEPLATDHLDALVSWDLPVLLHESSEHELLDVDWPVDLDARLLLPQAVPPIDDNLEIPELLPPVSGLDEELVPILEFEDDLPSEFLPAVQSTPETPSQYNAPSVPSPTFEQFLTQRRTAIDVTVGRPTFVENAALRHFSSLRGHPTSPPVLVLPDPPKQIKAPKPSRSHLPLEPKVEENLPRIRSIASYRLSQMTTLCARLSTFGFDLVDDAGDDTLDLCGPDLVFDIVSGVIFWKMAQLAEHEEALCSLLHAFSGAFANQLLVLELYHATGLAPDSFSPAYQQTFALKKRLPDQVTVKLSYSPFDSAREARLFADKHRRESWLWTEPRDWLTDEPAETVHRLILETQNLHLFAAQAVLARLPVRGRSLSQLLLISCIGSEMGNPYQGRQGCPCGSSMARVVMGRSSVLFSCVVLFICRSPAQGLKHSRYLANGRNPSLCNASTDYFLSVRCFSAASTILRPVRKPLRFRTCVMYCSTVRPRRTSLVKTHPLRHVLAICGIAQVFQLLFGRGYPEGILVQHLEAMEHELRAGGTRCTCADFCALHQSVRLRSCGPRLPQNRNCPRRESRRGW
jgi:hypothetical protein